MSTKIGVQLMMLKENFKQLGIYETMRKLADMGYASVEVSQIEMSAENVAELRRASQDFNIDVAALSASLSPSTPNDPSETLTTHFDKIVADCKALDCTYLRIGMLPFSFMGDINAVIQFAKDAEVMCKKLSDLGIKLYYHNHHVEFQKFDGKYMLDIIAENAPSMGFELDVHWIQRGGEEPVKIIKQFAGKVGLLHLKDYRIGAVDLTPLKSGDMKAFFAAFSNVVEFAEVGEGNLDMKAIIEAGKESGAIYFLIEQDNQYGRDPLDCLATSRDNLIKLGYGDWFKK